MSSGEQVGRLIAIDQNWQDIPGRYWTGGAFGVEGVVDSRIEEDIWDAVTDAGDASNVVLCASSRLTALREAGLDHMSPEYRDAVSEEITKILQSNRQ